MKVEENCKKAERKEKEYEEKMKEDWKKVASKLKGRRKKVLRML